MQETALPHAFCKLIWVQVSGLGGKHFYYTGGIIYTTHGYLKLVIVSYVYSTAPLKRPTLLQVDDGLRGGQSHKRIL